MTVDTDTQMNSCLHATGLCCVATAVDKRTIITTADILIAVFQLNLVPPLDLENLRGYVVHFMSANKQCKSIEWNSKH